MYNDFDGVENNEIRQLLIEFYSFLVKKPSNAQIDVFFGENTHIFDHFIHILSKLPEMIEKIGINNWYILYKLSFYFILNSNEREEIVAKFLELLEIDPILQNSDTIGLIIQNLLYWVSKQKELNSKKLIIDVLFAKLEGLYTKNLINNAMYDTNLRKIIYELSDDVQIAKMKILIPSKYHPLLNRICQINDLGLFSKDNGK